MGDLIRMLLQPTCAWVTYTKVKRGPGATHFCTSCHLISKTRACRLKDPDHD